MAPWRLTSGELGKSPPPWPGHPGHLPYCSWHHAKICLGGPWPSCGPGGPQPHTGQSGVGWDCSNPGAPRRGGGGSVAHVVDTCVAACPPVEDTLHSDNELPSPLAPGLLNPSLTLDQCAEHYYFISTQHWKTSMPVQYMKYITPYRLCTNYWF